MIIKSHTTAGWQPKRQAGLWAGCKTGLWEKCVMRKEGLMRLGVNLPKWTIKSANKYIYQIIHKNASNNVNLS